MYNQSWIPGQARNDISTFRIHWSYCKIVTMSNVTKADLRDMENRLKSFGWGVAATSIGVLFAGLSLFWSLITN